MRKPSQRIDLLRLLDADKALHEARRLREAGNIPAAAGLVAGLVQALPNHVGGLRLMGLLATQTGNADLAVDCFTRALAEEPRAVDIALQLGEALLAANQPARAAAAFYKALALRKSEGAAWRGLAQAQLELDDTSNALRSFRRALSILPYDQYSAHMIAALSGENIAAARAYVPALFNQYAGIFDEHLTETLHYRIPQLMAECLGNSDFSTALDLGCGTGLVAAALAGRVGVIDGIDIAPEMIARARARQLYRTLQTGELSAVLLHDEAFSGPYDLVTAADVFIYVGRLETAFAAIRPRLAPGARFVFSVEALDRGDVAIRASGRYAHAHRYVEALAGEHALRVEQAMDVTIRHERNRPIPGRLWVLMA